jgi:glyoxylase-like metal-dependent hydrolase (beta-lactamase superfamily II)
MTRLDVPGQDIVGLRAPNPGPFTLSGTNSWIVGRDPAWLIDPAPPMRDHLQALTAEIESRGGLGGIALTHDHGDHSEGVPAIRQRYPTALLGANRGDVDDRLEDGSSFGPLTAVRTPGHAQDHLAYINGQVGFTGDTVLGEGSVFIAPYPGALGEYLAGLERLRGADLRFLCPGHGPVVADPPAKLEEYISHRLEREARLLDALDRGARSVQEMLNDAWADVPAHLRGAATWTLAAHLHKLHEEGRLPADVERPPEDLLLRGG